MEEKLNIERMSVEEPWNVGVNIQKSDEMPKNDMPSKSVYKAIARCVQEVAKAGLRERVDRADQPSHDYATQQTNRH